MMTVADIDVPTPDAVGPKKHGILGLAGLGKEIGTALMPKSM